MGNFIRGGPQVPVVLASLILWGSFAWGLPADAPVTEDEADVASAEGAWNCDRCGTANDASAKYCTECGAKRPTDAEAAVAAEDPWAGVKISDAYDYAKCPECGYKNEIRAEACARCGYELPQPSAEITDPAWVFLPGKGYYREGTLAEPAKSREALWLAGLVVGGLGLTLTTVVYSGIVDSKSPTWDVVLFAAGPIMAGLGAVAFISGVSSRTSLVYAFRRGEQGVSLNRRANGQNPLGHVDIGLKVEVTALVF